VPAYAYQDVSVLYIDRFVKFITNVLIASRQI